MRAAAFYEGKAWREHVVAVVDGAVRVMRDASPESLPRLDGVVTGGFTDAHVHLQLVDAAALADSTLGAVVDLGGEPGALRSLAARFDSLRSLNERESVRSLSEDARSAPESKRRLRVAYAGAFLTPPGGYPSDRAWAPPGAVREIGDADAAASAVAEMKLSSATCIKVASNSTAGPVFADDLFHGIVEIAASHGLSVIAHAEGPGEAMRAARLGARMLAHAPFSERLSDDELHAMRGRIGWISTLGIHDGEAYAIAVDNVRRFRAIGGEVVYGTDMGNGETPLGLNPREIAALREAGFDGDDLLRALAPVSTGRLLLHPGATPDTADPLSARPLTPADLEASP